MIKKLIVNADDFGARECANYRNLCKSGLKSETGGYRKSLY